MTRGRWPEDGHAAWPESFNEMFALVAGDFGNAAVRCHGRAYLLGLLSHAERKNSWSLAEFAGDVSPDGLQRLLNFSPWATSRSTTAAPSCYSISSPRGRNEPPSRWGPTCHSA